MKEIPIPECSNNRRTSMKCRRMCCRKPTPKVEDTTKQQRLFALPTKSYDLSEVRKQMKIASELIFRNRLQ